jgi:hypothetical protein
MNVMIAEVGRDQFFNVQTQLNLRILHFFGCMISERLILSRFSGDERRGFGLVLGFVDNVNTRLVITLYRSLTHTD